jgi:4-amino-4-deoxy-L-arabinose transferase-like glycosyltransferase
MSRRNHRSLSPSRIALLGLLAVCAVAVFLRLYRFDSIPPGFCVDEGVNALDTLDLLAGKFQIFFSDHFGREPLFIYLMAASIRLLGRTAVAVRLPSALVGIATIPLYYWCVTQIFYRRSDRRALALLCAALMAVSFWHLMPSRFGMRAITLPLLTVLAFGLFWRALRTERKADFAWAGVALGASQYTYLASRFLPVVIGVFSLGWLLWERREESQKPQRTHRALAVNRGMLANLAVVALAALLVFAPLAIHFSQVPQDFVARAETVSIFTMRGDTSLLKAFLTSAWKHLAMFGIHGDDNVRYNLPGRPVFGPIGFALTLGGLILAAWRFRQREYGFLLVWLPTMLLPGILTATEIPNSLRTLGTLPVALIFPALALGEAYSALSKHRPRLRWIAVAAAVALAVGTGCLTFRDYFLRWAPREDVYISFGGDYLDMARTLQAHPEEPVVISTAYYRHPTLRFLLGEKRALRQFDGRYVLVQVPPDEQPVATLFAQSSLPPTEIVSRFLPDKLRLQAERGFSVYNLSEPWPMDHEVDYLLDDQIRLTGYTLFADSQDQPWLVLRWEVQRGVREEAEQYRLYDVFVHVLDEQGQRVAQGDQPLWYPMVEWAPGDQILSWHQIRPAKLAAGSYTIGVGLSFPSGRLSVAGQADGMAPLGPVDWPPEPGP